MSVGTEPPPAPGTERLQVGDWTVEPALNQLSAAGKTVKLEPKAMAVLVYLADRPGQVVSREALLSAVWSGVVVSDDSLTQVVIKLRKALGDTPETPAAASRVAAMPAPAIHGTRRLRWVFKGSAFGRMGAEELSADRITGAMSR